LHERGYAYRHDLLAGYRRLQRAAKAERRSLSRYLEQVVRREIAIQAEAEAGLQMFVPPEAVALRGDPGDLLRTPHETDERFARRQDVFSELLKLSPAG